MADELAAKWLIYEDPFNPKKASSSRAGKGKFIVGDKAVSTAPTTKK